MNVFATSASLLAAETKAAQILTWLESQPQAILMLAAAAIIAVIFVVPFIVGSLIAKSIRMTGYGWKIGLILFTLVASSCAVYFGWPPKLGVDLAGGYIFVWQIDLEKQADQQTLDKNKVGPSQDDRNALIEALKRRLNPDGLKEMSVRRYGASEIEIIVPETDPAEIAKIKQQILTQGMLEFLILAEQGTHSALMEKARAQSQNESTRRLRLVKDGEATIGKWVRIGSEEDKAGVKELAISGGWSNYLVRNSGTAELIDPARIPTGSDRVKKWLETEKITALEVLTKIQEDARVTGGDLALNGARAGSDERGFPSVEFTFRTAGGIRMAKLTGDNVGRSLAISLDDTLLSYANIRSQIQNNGQITGRFTNERVDFIVRILKAGSLPASLHPVPLREEPCDPTLGAENVSKGKLAIGVSLIAVFLFTLFYYRFAGFVACFALAANILITLGVMILFGATFTMPGLAGMVLTVGMSVDSNVLIFERMREELAKGASLRMAIRNGFDRAMATIIDSNLTTLLTAVILYLIGTDQLVGFAVTLTLGIVISMFTAIFCSRVIFEIAEKAMHMKTLSMMQFLTKTNIDFVSYQWTCIAASIVCIAVGIGASLYRGAGIFDIDLRGGTSIQLALKEPMSSAEISKLLDVAFEGQTHEGAVVDYTLKPIGSADAQGRRTTYSVDTILPDTVFVQDLLKKHLKAGDESLLKFYQVEFDSVGPSPEKTSDVPADEAAYFTVLNQDEKAAEPKAEAKTAEPKTEPKPGELDVKPAEKQEGTPAAKANAPAEKAAASEEKKPEVGDVKPAAKPAVVIEKVKSRVKFNDNTGKSEGIDAAALATRLQVAATELNIETLDISVDHPDWDRVPESRRSEWDVSLSASPADAQRILERMRADLVLDPVWPASKKIGGQIAGDFVWIAIKAMIVSLLGIIAYIWVRFQNLYWGFAAVLALFHDVLFMLAGIAVSKWLVGSLGSSLGIEEFKIDLTIIAAFLTLIGYSINDTIVIFDRMREVKGKSPHLTKQIVNDSVNQTLSRTFLTFFTTFITIVVLYAVGGPGIHGFAFAMLVGSVVGVYSSVYIAPPFLLWMVERERLSAAKKPFGK